MIPSFIPSLFVTLIGLIFPVITIAFLFIYIKKDEIV